MIVNKRLEQFRNEQIDLTTFFCRRANYMFPTHAGFDLYGEPGNVEVFTEDLNAMEKAGYSIKSSSGAIDPPISVILREDKDRIAYVVGPNGTFHVRRAGEPRAEVVNVAADNIEERSDSRTVYPPFASQSVPAKAHGDEPPSGGNGHASLYAKMARVMGMLNTVAKNGYNEFQKYKYVTSGDMYDAVRKAMAKESLALMVRYIDHRQEEQTFTDNYGKTKNQTMTYVNLEFVLACGETGAIVTIPWLGSTSTTHDKSIAGAITNAEKAFLQSTFIVSTGDLSEDPDSNNQEDTQRRAQPESQQKRQRQQAQQPPTQTKTNSGGEALEIAPATLILKVKQDAGVRALQAHDYHVVNTINKMWREHGLSEDETDVLGKLVQLTIDSLKKKQAEAPEEPVAK